MSWHIKGFPGVSNCVLKTGLKFHLNLHLNERRTLKVNDPIQAQTLRSATEIHSTILLGTKVQTRTCVFQTQTWAQCSPLSASCTWATLKGIFFSSFLHFSTFYCECDFSQELITFGSWYVGFGSGGILFKYIHLRTYIWTAALAGKSATGTFNGYCLKM